MCQLYLIKICLTRFMELLLFTTSETTTEQDKMMATQIPQEVIVMAQGAVRIMIEDGVTPDMFAEDMERLTKVYIEASVQRQARICMNYLTCSSVRDAALDAILSTLKAA